MVPFGSTGKRTLTHMRPAPSIVASRTVTTFAVPSGVLRARRATALARRSGCARAIVGRRTAVQRDRKREVGSGRGRPILSAGGGEHGLRSDPRRLTLVGGDGQVFELDRDRQE